jgi:hypothetical protein
VSVYDLRFSGYFFPNDGLCSRFFCSVVPNLAELPFLFAGFVAFIGH